MNLVVCESGELNEAGAEGDTTGARKFWAPEAIQII